MTAVVLAILPAVVAALLARSLIRVRIPRLMAANRRGQRLPVVLGLAVITATESAILGVLLAVALAGEWDLRYGKVTWVALAVLLVALAGFMDDVTGRGPRGLRGHLGSLTDGRFSTGILKVVVFGVAGLGVAAVTMEGRGILAVILAAGITAGSANIWNGLDVAPGRAGKFFLVVAIPTLFTPVHSPAWLLLLFAVGAIAGVIPFDLRERGMLGDAGSNVIGFIVGATLAPGLSMLGLALCFLGAFGLNVVADTITFSRIIGAFAPLRWFDQFLRLPPGPRFSSN